MKDEQFTRIAKALADPRRFEVFEMIVSAGELSCGDIADRFPIGQSTVSHHLRLLIEAGLVNVRREGQHGYFTAVSQVLQIYIDDLQRRLTAGSEDHKAKL